MLSQDVCPSVCLFVRHTPVSVETSLHIIKLFSPLGSHTTLLLQYQTLRQYFDGDRPPPLQARLIRGYEKIGFSTYLTVSWKQYKIRPLLLCYKLLNGTIFNDLSDSVKYLMARSIARPLCDQHLVITYDMNTPKTSKHNYTLQSAAEAAAVAATF